MNDEMQINYSVFPLNKGRTKWDVLAARRIAVRKELDRLTREMAGLENTACGLTCGKCGTVLETEADFAKHFVIPDERYLNLGNCPQD